MLALCAFLLVLALAGCGERDRPPVEGPPAPSAAVQKNCRALYPKHPAMVQACLRRWTTGEAMPGPSIEPLPFQSDADKAVVLAQWCSGMAGIPPAGQHVMMPKQVRTMLACVDAGFAREGLQLPER